MEGYPTTSARGGSAVHTAGDRAQSMAAPPRHEHTVYAEIMARLLRRKRRRRCARWRAASTKPATESSATIMAANDARSTAAPPRYPHTAYAKKHGGPGKCLVGSCSANATNKGGFCGRHGGKDGFCTTAGCETPRVYGSRVCFKHGAHGTCTASGCSANAKTRILTKWPALPKAAAATHKHGEYVGSMTGRSQSALSTTECGSVAKARGLCRKTRRLRNMPG